MPTAITLLRRYPLLSNQVDLDDLKLVLTHLEGVLDAQIPGDIVEFGCYIGTTSVFIQRLLTERHEQRSFHVYDSFEGLPTKRPEDVSVTGEQFQAGQLAASKKQFLREFQRLGLMPPYVHKGWFEELGPQDVPEHIAFAFLDGDFYSSIRASLKLVLPRMSRGGIIMIHDYAREALPGVAKAVHELGLRPRTVHRLGIIAQS